MVESEIGLLCRGILTSLSSRLLTVAAGGLRRLALQLTRARVVLERSQARTVNNETGREQAVNRAPLAAQQRHDRLATQVVASVKKALATEEWHPGDMLWIASLDRVTAAVVASVTPERLTLAMGSSRFAYEQGFSPADPSLCHSKQEALARAGLYR